MTVYEVVPHFGVGPVRLGMSRDEVRRVMPSPCKPFRKTADDMQETDAFHDSDLQVFYGGDSLIVEYIELSRGSGFVASYRGVDVFATPADAVVARVCCDALFDPEHPDLGYSYIFPRLDLSLWRSTLPESPEDQGGREFSTIGVGVPGYYRDLA